MLEALAEEEEGEVGMEDMEEVLEVPSNKSRCIGGSTSTVWFFLLHTFPPLTVRREGVVSCNTKQDQAGEPLKCNQCPTLK